MLRRSRSIPVLLLVIPFLVTLACGGSQPKAGEPAAQQAPPTKPVTELTKDMHERLGRVTVIQHAVIRGDLEAAAEPAKWIVDQQDTAGFPAESAKYITDMKKFAANVAAAKDVPAAATSTAMMISYCGACHSAAKVTLTLTELPKPVGLKGPALHMREHEWAIDQMYRGLTSPSEDLWKKGVEALKEAPMAAKDLPKDAGLTKEVMASETKIHEQAEKALKTTDMGSKVALYGEVLKECATCHSLHGRVWGPGLGKAK